MKLKRILAAILALMLLLSGCAGGKGENPTVDTGNPFETSSTAPTETKEAIDSKWEELLTYEAYLEMSYQERSDFQESFSDTGEFFQWMENVKAIYEENRKENELGQDGNIDMDKINPEG